MDKDVCGMYIGIVAIEKNNAICSDKWMDLEIIILSKSSYKEKDRYPMLALLWNLKYDTQKNK